MLIHKRLLRAQTKVEACRLFKQKKTQSLPKIWVLAPGMPFDRDQLDQSLTLLKTWGFEVHVPLELMNRAHPVCASDRLSRWKQLREALLYPSNDILWAVRGGYGSLHLLPELQKIKKPSFSKLLIGFSDNTSLHQYFNQEWNWSSWHGPHLDRLASLGKKELTSLRRLLFGEEENIYFRGLRPLNEAAKQCRSLRGTIVGGNLITLQSSLGTKWALRPQGRILFIEDIGERGYRIDRVLEHFTQAQVFRGVKALLVGPFVGGKEPSGKDLTKKVLADFAKRFSFPVFDNIPSGHIAKSQLLPLGTNAHLQVAKKQIDLVVSTGWKR